MDRKARWVILAILFGAGICCPAAGQNLPDEARNAATTWLLKDCDVDESTDLEGILRKYKAQLEPFFLTALRTGPDAQLLNAVDAAAARRFLYRQEALKTGSGLGLSDKDLAEARLLTREQYINQQKKDFVLRYKSQAISGLGIVDGKNGKRALQAIASDAASPLYGSAKIALLEIQNRQPLK